MSLSIFRYNPESYPDVFNEATGIVRALFANSHICASLCDPVASRFPKENYDVPDYLESTLVSEVQKTLGLGVEIMDDAKSSNCMEMHPNDSSLHVNRKYFDYSFANDDEHNRCLLLLVNKLIHELFHALTTTFYILRGHVELEEKDENGKRKFVMTTPTNLGKSYGKGRSIIGDNGFAFEEHFTGGRLVAPSIALSYKDPLIIMLVDKHCLKRFSFYHVKEDMITAALSWYRKPTKETVHALRLYDPATSIAYVPPPNKRKQEADNLATPGQPKLKQSSKGGGIIEEFEEEDTLAESGLRGHTDDIPDEREEEYKEDEMEPFDRLIYSRNYTTDSGDEVKVV